MVISKRCRRWSREEKERLVAATLAPGETVVNIARCAGVNENMLYKWRKEIGVNGGATVPPLLPVALASVAPKPASTGLIEIEVGNRTVRVDKNVNADALRVVIDILEKRQ